MLYLNRRLPRGKGLLDRLIKTFRQNKVSRVIFSSGYFENWDHTAIFYAGMYCAPQAGDSILGDLGPFHPLKSYFIYSIWGDFKPLNKESVNISADLGILASEKEEARIRKAIQAFSSQDKIIKNIVAQRKKGESEEGYLELYQKAEVRKPIDYKPYFKLIKKCTR